jgi:hypothetical protein
MSQKQGFLKGLILKGQKEEPEKVTPATKVASTTPTPQNQVNPMTIQGVADNKFIELLEGIIEQNNLPGQDYFEFKQAIENMKSLPMDEKTKFQTVYSVLSLQGCNKEILLSSTDKYIAIIQQEKTNFDVEMKKAYAEKVQSKLNEAEKAKKEVESLTTKLSELNNQAILASQEAQKAEMEIRATEANFKASADIIIGEMAADKEKINTFIV